MFWMSTSSTTVTGSTSLILAPWIWVPVTMISRSGLWLLAVVTSTGALAAGSCACAAVAAITLAPHIRASLPRSFIDIVILPVFQ